jgi:hypothetical protein
MKKGLIILFLLFVSCYGFSQSGKELKKLFLAAKDSGQVQYVILRTGEKKEIKDVSFPGEINRNGKIEYGDGEKEKYKSGRIIQCQTNEAFYKLAKYTPEKSDHMAYDSALASRMKKGAINVYFLATSYRVMFKNEFSYEVFYFIEVENNGKLIQLMNDPRVVDMVEGLVMKSGRAKKSIEELRKAYGTLAIKFSTSSKLREAIDYYNDDFANGKLTKG